MTSTSICVLVADASRARCLWLREHDVPGHERIKLEEEKAWVHPASRLLDHQRYRDSKPVGRQGADTGQTHAFDDHRQARDDDEKRRFAAQVADDFAKLASVRNATRVVVCTSHGLGASLSRAWKRGDLAGLRTDWVAAEVAERSPRDIHEFLANQRLLPAPKAPRVKR